MSAKITITQRIAAVLTVAFAVAACGNDGGSNPQAGGDVLDDGQTSPGVASFPVTAEYAGLTWSIMDVEVVPGDEEALLADLRVTNHNPFGMKWDVRVITLETSDGVTITPAGMTGTGSWNIDISDEKTTEATLEFEAVPESAIDGLSLVVGGEDRIPEVVPFAGGAEAKPYPIDAAFSGTTEPLPLDRLGGGGWGDQVMTVTAVAARIDLDGLGHRAPTGGRLAVIEVRLDVPATNTKSIRIQEGDYRLDVDGTQTPPSVLYTRLPNTPGNRASVAPGSSEPVTLVFEIPAGARELALVVTTEDGEDSDQIPVTIGALPPCCGE